MSTVNPIPRLLVCPGPVLLSYGFRPFFLFGAIFAAGAVLMWLPMSYGELTMATAFAPRDWHVHEMLYGYIAAVMTGFLLTAIPNWTGRLPIQGGPLLVLVAVWLTGRIAIALSAKIGWLPAAIIDVCFLLLVGAAAMREIAAGRNWRNLKIVAMIGLFLAGNIAFHVEAHLHGAADYGIRIGIAAMVLLITVIGGRIIPSFTRNWLVRENPGRLPAPFARFDVIVIAATAASLALWTATPASAWTAPALAVTGILQIARLLRWAGYRTWRDRLVLVLHAGYIFVPLGFLFVSAAAYGMASASAGIHAWTAGAAGLMTLAVMTRATLGHTGQALVASAETQLIYALAAIAACARIGAAMAQQWSEPLMWLSAFAWAGAFIGFAIAYGPALCGRRKTILR